MYTHIDIKIYVNMCTYTYVHMYIYIHICKYIYTYIYTYIHVCIRRKKYIYIYVYVYICIFVSILFFVSKNAHSEHISLDNKRWWVFAGVEEGSLSYIVLLGVVTTGGEFVAGSCRGTWASARRKCGNFPG